MKICTSPMVIRLLGIHWPVLLVWLYSTKLSSKILCAKAQRLGEYLRRRLDNLKKYGVVREIRGRGVLLGVELVKDTKSMEPFPALGMELKWTALEQGLILRVDPSWFAVAPPLIAEEKDLDEMCDLIEMSLCTALDRVKVRDR